MAVAIRGGHVSAGSHGDDILTVLERLCEVADVGDDILVAVDR